MNTSCIDGEARALALDRSSFVHFVLGEASGVVVGNWGGYLLMDRIATV